MPVDVDAATPVAAEAVPDLRATFRLHPYRRLTRYANPDLLLRGAPEPKRSAVGWMTAVDAVVLIEPGADGIIFLDRSTVLAQSCLQRRPRLSRPGIQSRAQVHPHPADVIELDIEAAVVIRPCWHNYFHWMIQFLPMALHSAEVHPGAEIILPTHGSFDGLALQPSFSEATYLQTLDVVLGPDRPTRLLPPGYYRFPAVHIPLHPQPSIFGHSFRDRYFQRFDPILGLRSQRGSYEGAREARRIFIPRSGAKNRGRVAEEVHATAARLASEAGYETVDLSTMTWVDQLKVFAEASHVFAVHGAGLTNIVFANDATVIEYNEPVSGETELRDPYFELSCDLGHRYFLIRDVDLDHIDADMLAV